MLGRLRRSLFLRTLGLIPGRLRWIYLLATVIDRVNCSLLLNIVLAFILKDVLDAATRGDMARLEHAALLAALAMFVGAPVSIATVYALKWCFEETARSIRHGLFSHVVALRQQEMDGWHSGDVVSRTSNDYNATVGLYGHLSGLFFAIIHGTIAMVAIFLLDWRCGMIVGAMGLITLLVNTAFARPLRRWSDRIQKSMGAVTERLTDLLHGLVVTKMYHLEEETHGQYTRRNQELTTAVLARGRINAVLETAGSLIYNVRTVGLLAFGLYLLISGDPIEVGTVAAIVKLQSDADFLFITVGSFVAGIQGSLAGAARMFELLDAPAEPADHTGPAALQSVSHGDALIGLRGVRFSYRGRSQPDSDGEEERESPPVPVLHGIDMDVSAGQRVALVGPSGGGKTTLLKLLLGLYTPASGEIAINGSPAGDGSLHQRRRLMAYVGQDAFMFHGTIADNIRYGRIGASMDEVVNAARTAHAHDFIEEQPDGYDTVVGERGARLSGGQRQRLAIARGLLRDAPILLLDEATSALDSESEQLVQAALEELMRGHTTIAVAHRLSTIESCNTIYVIDAGRVVEQGTHAELLSRRGTYQRLHDMQFRTAT